MQVRLPLVFDLDETLLVAKSQSQLTKELRALRDVRWVPLRLGTAGGWLACKWPAAEAVPNAPSHPAERSPFPHFNPPCCLAPSASVLQAPRAAARHWRPAAGGQAQGAGPGGSSDEGGRCMQLVAEARGWGLGCSGADAKLPPGHLRAAAAAHGARRRGGCQAAPLLASS